MRHDYSPAASTRTPYGRYNPALVAGPLSPEYVIDPVPAIVVMIYTVEGLILGELLGVDVVVGIEVVGTKVGLMLEEQVSK